MGIDAVQSCSVHGISIFMAQAFNFLRSNSSGANSVQTTEPVTEKDKG